MGIVGADARPQPVSLPDSTATYAPLNPEPTLPCPGPYPSPQCSSVSRATGPEPWMSSPDPVIPMRFDPLAHCPSTWGPTSPKPVEGRSLSPRSRRISSVVTSPSKLGPGAADWHRPCDRLPPYLSLCCVCLPPAFNTCASWGVSCSAHKCPGRVPFVTPPPPSPSLRPSTSVTNARSNSSRKTHCGNQVCSKLLPCCLLVRNHPPTSAVSTVTRRWAGKVRNSDGGGSGRSQVGAGQRHRAPSWAGVWDWGSTRRAPYPSKGSRKRSHLVRPVSSHSPDLIPPLLLPPTVTHTSTSSVVYLTRVSVGVCRRGALQLA